MILFLIALAVGVVAAAILWKMGQRDPGPVSDRKPRPRLAAVAKLLYWAMISYVPVSAAFDGWAALGDMAAQLSQTGALAVDPKELKGARYDLVMGVAAATISVAIMAFVVIPDLFKAFMRPATDASAKLQETHA